MAPSDIEAPQYAAKVPERIDELRRTHFALSETAYVRKDGTVIPIELSSRIIKFKGRSVILSIARDISDRKKMTEIREQFLSHVTHELRTPLVSIKGYLDLAVSGALGAVPKEIESGLQIVKRNADRLLSLTNDLLDFRRLEAGKFQLNKAPLNLQDIIKDCVEEIQPSINQRKQNLNLEVAERPLLVQGDAVRLSQVLVNLLSNANKFAPEGGTITLRSTEEEDVIQVQVSDKGIGINMEDLGRVFEPFAAIEKPTYVKGTGLGLSITKGLVEVHGGRIWAESEGEGKGATFSFTIPKRKEEV
jgi:signal transduction histidine kinase